MAITVPTGNGLTVEQFREIGREVYWNSVPHFRGETPQDRADAVCMTLTGQPRLWVLEGIRNAAYQVGNDVPGNYARTLLQAVWKDSTREGLK